MFSDKDVLAKLDELDVELVVVDDTLRESRIAQDLKRVGRTVIPVNLIYPPNYPTEPAILIDALFSPKEAIKVLERMEKIQSSLNTTP